MLISKMCNFLGLPKVPFDLAQCFYVLGDEEEEASIAKWLHVTTLPNRVFNKATKAGRQ